MQDTTVNTLIHRGMQSSSSERGMTLIDVSILTVIFSLLLLGLLQQIGLEQKKAFTDENIYKIEVVADALKDYVLLNAALPVPADPTLDYTSDQFGVPVAAVPTDCSLTGGAVNGVICRPGSRDTNIDSDSTVSNNPGERVLIGAVPVTALGLLPKDGLDLYGNKYTYAVTTASTDPSTIDDDRGVIKIVSSEDNTEDAYDTYSDVHYVVISHGENGEGAYLRDGSRPDNCLSIREQEQEDERDDDEEGAYLQAENENCDDDGVFAVATRGDMTVADNLEVLTNGFNFGDGKEYVDDFIRYEQSLFGRFWTARGEEDGSVNVFMTSGEGGVSKVGINTGKDDLYAQLTVDGDVLTEKLVTTRLCNDQRSMCFTVDNVVNSEPPSESNLKCYTRGVKSIFLTGSALSSQADKSCDIDTRVTVAYDLGVEDVDGTICEDGASGLDDEGKLKCK